MRIALSALAALLLLAPAPGLAQAPPPPTAAATPVKPIVFRELFTVENYPYQALIRSIEGRVVVRLSVGADGRVKACTTNADAPPDLAAGTCEMVIAQARFEPARDPAGRPVAGEYRQRVRWVLEDNDPAPFESAQELIIVRFDKDGLVESCHQQASHPDMADPRSCEGAKENAIKLSYELPDEVALDEVELVFETLWRPGLEAPALADSDDKLMFAAGSHMDIWIAANGRVTKCAVRRSGVWGPDFMDSRCKAVIGTLYEVARARERRMQIVDFIYLRERQAGVIG